MLRIPKKISNPMSIIGIFAAISETSAAVSLPFLGDQDRELYVWFLISFPFYLIFLFFLTLNFNYRSLYSPSDFEEDKNFLKTLNKNEHDSSRNISTIEPQTRCTIGVSSTVLFCQERSKDSQKTQSMANSSLQTEHKKIFIQHNIKLSDSIQNLHTIDTCQMDSKTDFVAILEKIRQNNKEDSRLVVFLTNDVSDILLKQNVLRLNKQPKKVVNATPCIIYNTASQNITVLERF